MARNGNLLAVLAEPLACIARPPVGAQPLQSLGLVLPVFSKQSTDR
jgi:hypothetical protein